ncbi:hypothetical protein C479_11330 [Halovivax asiaticus JCM 14624]|uniref:Uncharacterized protein n=1 Tax=Halovivax asiaticus JCM 14624 TaxID=1227490 RepID=M0BGH9_9EURY|nr:hypothetical protein [Halovivax asiaticus]ELZ09408.1 hypothetical protein C479_11330 [Halovivax asiaticus JCM 14624]
MRPDTHNTLIRGTFAALPIFLIVCTVGFIALFSATGAAAVDTDTGTEIGNETVEVTNATTEVTAYVANESAITTETNVTAWIYPGTDTANLTAVANATTTLNATDTSAAITVDVSNETVELEAAEDWMALVVGDGNASAVTLTDVDTTTAGGGGGGVIGDEQTAGFAAGVLILAAVAFALARRFD